MKRTRQHYEDSKSTDGNQHVVVGPRRRTSGGTQSVGARSVWGHMYVAYLDIEEGKHGLNLCSKKRFEDHGGGPMAGVTVRTH